MFAGKRYDLPGMLSNEDHLHKRQRINPSSFRNLNHIVFGLEVSWNVQLVHANGRRRPASTLERIEDPASPVISAGVLIPRHRAMDLNHRVQHILDMLFVRQ